MKDFIERSQSLQETAQTKKGMIWILELLVFIAVFLAGTFAQLIVVLPAQLIMMYTNREYMNAAVSGDKKQLNILAAQMLSSDFYMVLSLFSEIMLIVPVFLFCRFLQKRKLRTLGFVKKDMWKEYGIGLLAGFLFFSVCVGLSLLTGGLKCSGVAVNFSVGIFILYFLGFAVQGMAEEVLCRGYFLSSYARRYPVYAAVLANSLFFAGLHLLNSGLTPLAFLNLVLFGIFASLYFVRRGNIWGVGAFHTMWNLVQGNFYGIKVSGMAMGNTFFTMESVAGKGLLNGGDFGMEGSLICTIVYALGIIWFIMRKNKDQEAASRSFD